MTSSDTKVNATSAISAEMKPREGGLRIPSFLQSTPDFLGRFFFPIEIDVWPALYDALPCMEMTDLKQENTITNSNLHDTTAVEISVVQLNTSYSTGGGKLAQLARVQGR